MLIILGPIGDAIISENTLGFHLGLDQIDIHMNHGVEDLCATTLPQEGSDVGRECVSRIDFRQQDVQCLERQRHLLPHPGDGVNSRSIPSTAKAPRRREGVEVLATRGAYIKMPRVGGVSIRIKSNR